jgi:riboflavin kinase/FMN adenylyltransferase
VIAAASEVAAEYGVPLGVVTFEPHPRSFFAPSAPPFRLSSLRSKAHRLEALGVDFLVALHFDKAFSRMLAQDFVLDALASGLGVCHVVVGYDFVFGHRRAGDTAVLGCMAAMEGFGLTVVEAVGPTPGMEGAGVFSSTRIRNLLQSGKPREAADLLGHWWEVEARVQSGDQRGRQLGFPTANLSLGDYVQPALGVYAVRVALDEEGLVWHDAVANLGRRPTFDKQEVLLEVHLLDFDEDIYGRNLRVAFVDYIREERKFDGLEALKEQISLDREQARAILAGPDKKFA